MDQLTTLLDRAAGPAPHADAANDLARGRRALARSRRRRGAVAVLGVAAAGVLGVGVVTNLQGSPAATVVAGPAPSAGPGALGSRHGRTLHVLGTSRWLVGAGRPSLRRRLCASRRRSRRRPGQLRRQARVLPGEQQAARGAHDVRGPRLLGAPQQRRGARRRRESFGRGPVQSLRRSGAELVREPWCVHHDQHAVSPDGDGGSLTVQYPDSTGLTQEQMVEFLASVEVAPGAELTYG